MSRKAKLILALGSNTEPEKNIRDAKVALRELFKDVKFSACVWSEPIGMRSGMFLNCLASAFTHSGYDRVNEALKQIERRQGSTKVYKNRGIVRMDIDILMLGDVKYHEADWGRAYVQNLLPQVDAMADFA